MNLVITGASGFIGSNLVERLWKQFRTLTLLSREPQLGMNAGIRQTVDAADSHRRGSRIDNLFNGT